MYVSLDIGDKMGKKMEREKEVPRSQKATGALIAGRRLLQGGSTQGRIRERARMKYTQRIYTKYTANMLPG